jgi:site-specific DNA-methyltransferase (adenine-specific)
MVTLWHGDCLEKMKLLPDKSVDMILCDPPYGTTACKWDAIIPFDLMWLELNRVIKDKSAIVLFGNEPFSSHLRLSNLSSFKYDWVWEKSDPSGFVNAKLMPIKSIEIISVFSKGKTANGTLNKMPYYPQGLIPFGKVVNLKRNKTHENSFGRESHKENHFQEFTNYPKQILKYGNDKKPKFHQTQKPVGLLEYLIKTYTLENETVLDFTMGSGSTGIACLNTNRKFIGIEKDDKYFQTAKDRIDTHILDYCERVSNFAPTI